MEKRNNLLIQIWDSQDEAYLLMNTYDTLPHYYGNSVLYQAEAYIVSEIGKYPGITTTMLAEHLGKTPSACSQLVKKLVVKGMVIQKRNEENKRQYNLYLTDEGQSVYKVHKDLNCECQDKTFEMLDSFSEEELKCYLAIQMKINEAYKKDIELSKNKFKET